jgi:hypothetical protein
MVVATGVRHTGGHGGGDFIATAVAGLEGVAGIAAVAVLALDQGDVITAVPVSGVALALAVRRRVVGLCAALVLLLLALVLVVLLAPLLLVLLVLLALVRLGRRWRGLFRASLSRHREGGAKR